MLKYFNGLENQKSLSFMTKMKPNNGNKTKSGIFSWDKFKFDSILIDRRYSKISMNFILVSFNFIEFSDA